MMNQRVVLPDKIFVTETKSKIVRQDESALLQKLKKINEKLTEQAKRNVAEAREKGVSSWLSMLLLEEFGFVLNKGEFRDAIRLRYAKELRGLPCQCPCCQ